MTENMQELCVTYLEIPWKINSKKILLIAQFYFLSVQLGGDGSTCAYIKHVVLFDKNVQP